MDPALYPRMAAVEDTHWWFAARRAICDRMIARFGVPPAATIFEPGCGTGGNFAMLARWGRLYAMDDDPAALSYASARGIGELARGHLPDQIPFGKIEFDLILMTDVLEHLDQPARALHALHARLKPGGRLLVTVPAMAWLWSEHDATHHHRQRFSAVALRRLTEAASFEIDYLSYYNFLLFPLIAGVRMGQRLRRQPSAGVNGRHDLTLPPAILNAILLRLFASERHLLGTIRIPFGVSLLMSAHA